MLCLWKTYILKNHANFHVSVGPEIVILTTSATTGDDKIAIDHRNSAVSVSL